MNWISGQDRNLYNLQLKYTRNIPQNNQSSIKNTTQQNKNQPYGIGVSLPLPTRLETRFPFSPLLFNIILEVLAETIKEKKKKKTK